MRVITGSARGRKLTAPAGLETRPTSDMTKEAVFSILQNQLENSEVLDLFAGSGQMGIEALSRGSRRAVFVDSAAQAISVIKSNLKACDMMDQSTVIQMDAQSYIKNSKSKFDIIILDPPYNKKLIDAVLPDAVRCMKEDGIILCETEKQEVLPQEQGQYAIAREYRYGKAKITVYRRKDEAECE